MPEYKSEIARFRAELALQEEAAQRGFYGFALTARHDMIIARMDRAADGILRLIQAGRYEEAEAIMEQPNWGSSQFPGRGQASPLPCHGAEKAFRV